VAPGSNASSPANVLTGSEVTEKQFNTLFICTGNSARSIMAEGLLNDLGGGHFRAFSAGSHPKGEVHPLALETLRNLRIPTDGFRSKAWDEFAQPDAPHLDFVFTVCDKAADEACPLWPGHPMTAHWGVPDPALLEGSPEQLARGFLETAFALRRRIQLFMALPLSSLDSLSIQREIDDIGKR
jgi:arsenate reductase